MIGRRMAAALLSSAIVSLLLAGSASAFKPLVGTYTGTTAGTTTNTLSVSLTNKQKRTFKTTLLTVADDCAGGFAVLPLPLGRLLAKDFKYTTSGTTTSFNYTVAVEGRFISTTQVFGRTGSTESSLIPPPGIP